MAVWLLENDDLETLCNLRNRGGKASPPQKPNDAWAANTERVERQASHGTDGMEATNRVMK